MPQTVQDAIKVWSAPAMLAVILVLSGFIWNGQQARIAALEVVVSGNQNALTTITANQVTSREDRVEFQDATTRRLDRMEDLLGTMTNAVTRLTTLQEKRVDP